MCGAGADEDDSTCHRIDSLPTLMLGDDDEHQALLC